jgi:SAM-dependent methyltransferase
MSLPVMRLVWIVVSDAVDRECPRLDPSRCLLVAAPCLRRLRRAPLPSSLTARVGGTKIDRVLSYRMLYRVGFTPWDDAPGPKLLDRVLDSESAGAGRRALDVGCGKGRVAKKGWEVTAVDLEERAIGKARERAAEAGAHVHWIVGDVTKLGTLATPPGYSLIYDLGCIQGLADEAAALAAEGITSLAAEDAAPSSSPSPAAAG